MARKKSALPAEQSPATPLLRARAAMEQGNVRLARQLAAEAAQAGPEAEREEARALLERTAPDRAALLTVGVVLLMVAIAAWLAILRVR